MMLQYNVDILHEIVKHLKLIDVYHFYCVSKFNCKYIDLKKIVINEINARLLHFFGNVTILDKFKKSLEMSGGIISGSFITQCILGEYWDNSDIDVFMPSIYETRRKLYNEVKLNRCEECRYGSCLHYTSDMERFINNHMKKCNDNDHVHSYGDMEIYQVTNYVLKNTMDFNNELIAWLTQNNITYKTNEKKKKNNIKKFREPEEEINKNISTQEKATTKIKSLKNKEKNEIIKVKPFELQIIQISNEYTPIEYVKTKFNFDTCKNYYFYNGKDNIYISNLYLLCNKIIDLTIVKYNYSSDKLFQKYKDRGFSFIGVPKINVQKSYYCKNDIDLPFATEDFSYKIQENILYDRTYMSHRKCNNKCIVNYIYKTKHVHVIQKFDKEIAVLI